MTIGSICKRNVVVAPKGESIVDVAKRMRMLHVGTVIVVEERGGRQAPAGILTDRDIVLSIVASDAEHLPFLNVDDAMSDDLLTLPEDTGLPEALKRGKPDGYHVLRLKLLLHDLKLRRSPFIRYSGVWDVRRSRILRRRRDPVAQPQPSPT